MKFILGKKLSMTQIWRNDIVVPVTCIKVEPCVITQIKTIERDGYRAVQLATGQRQEKNIAKPQRGHCGKLGNFQYLREFNLDQEQDCPEASLQVGQQIALNSFILGDRVQATSISKGRGFQGGVKRHGFHGQKRTHGNKDQQRMPGSVGATGPAHIFKGMRMAGRMGGEQVTVKNLEVVEIDEANGYLYLKGAVPGWRNGYVAVVGLGELAITQQVVSEEPISELIKEENITENIVETAETVAIAETEVEEPVIEPLEEENSEEIVAEVAEKSAEATVEEAVIAEKEVV